MKQINKTINMLILFCISILSLQAQNYNLLDVNKATDANPANGWFNGYYDQGYTKDAYAVLNSVAYFAANDGIHGTELWRSDGTSNGTGMVKDINPGIAPSNVHDIVVSGNKIYFAADDGTTGLEIWTSDGTANGTARLKDIFPGTAGSSPSYLADVNGTLFFFANYNGTANQLWRTNGTASSTKMVADFYTSQFNYSQYGNQITGLNGKIFFVLNGGGSYYYGGNSELWVSDGTANGTHLTKEINPDIYNGCLPFGFAAYNGLLYFSANDGSGRKLWASDGTNAGTKPVNNSNNIYLYDDAFNNAFNKITIVNNRLYFSGYSTDGDGSELCVYDPGNVANNIQVIKDFAPGNPSHNLYNLINVNGTLFFTVYGGLGNDQTLWKSDGTTAGTVMIKDANPGGRNIYLFKSFENANGTLLYSFYDDNNGYEIWKSDGTTSGTVVVKQIQAGIYGSNVQFITYVGNGNSLFQATNDKYGLELWRTDGTPAGTKLVKDINQTATSSSYPGWQIASSDSSGLFFVANDSKYGNELYASNGTTNGTKIVKDIFPGSFASYPSQTLNFNNATYFWANILDSTVTNTSDAYTTPRLFKTDGTTAGTSMLSVPNLENQIHYSAYIVKSIAAGNVIYYLLFNYITNHQELWRSDGTTAGTYAVKTDMDPYYSASPVSIGNTLFFTNYDYVYGYEVWKSDGTIAGTQIVKDITTGINASGPSNLIAYNGKLYFTDTKDYSANQLWVSDGTSAGTLIVKNNISIAIMLGVANNKLFFNNYTPAKGNELWTSDGTPAGTQLVKDIWPGVTGSFPNSGVSTGSLIYFTANDGVSGNELWKSDGTATGTSLVKDITQGSGSGDIFYQVNVNGKLYFIYSDVLWSSDGTDAGTNAVSDANLAGVSGYSNLVAAGTKLFFTAYTPAAGTELYVGNTAAAATAPAFASSAITNNTFKAMLYPNPAHNNTTVQISGNADDVSIIVTDMSGKTVWQGNYKNQLQVNLPLEKLMPGFYLVTISSGNEIKNLKLVKE